MLFSVMFPQYNKKKKILFSEIEQNILNRNVDAGLIIHENRFTYNEKGLEKVVDLGELWEEETGLPIPLGGIAVKRDIPQDIQQKIERVLRRSVEYAFANPNSSVNYVNTHSQELSKEVIDAHINLYVNNFSLSLGKKGKRAIEVLFEKAGVSTDNIFMFPVL